MKPAVVLCGLLIALDAWSAPALHDADAIPQLNDRGRAGYREFLAAASNRAFAIAPGGTWAWQAELPSEEAALDAAIADCQSHTAQRCVPYAVNDRMVFDAVLWPTLWGPYLAQTEATRAPVGTRRGERFPDLAFHTGEGKAVKLSALRGQVVVLHFWGSWCQPCRKEMPDLQKLHDAIATHPQIRFVLLPVREPFAKAKRWATQLGVRMPIFDAGMRDETDERLRLADGGWIEDRKIARTFPTTYVLDRHGIVVFSHTGAASRWLDYAPFLKDAAAKSGK